MSVLTLAYPKILLFNWNHFLTVAADGTDLTKKRLPKPKEFNKQGLEIANTPSLRIQATFLELPITLP